MRNFILALLLVWLAHPVLAADGDPCNSGVTYRGGQCLMLCDSDTTDVSCADLRLPSGVDGPLTVEIHTQAGCSACTIDVNWTARTGGQEHDIVTLSCTGVTAHTIDATVRPPGYITGTISGTAGPCTDLDVFVHLND